MAGGLLWGGVTASFSLAAHADVRASEESGRAGSLRIEGLVLWADPARHRLVLWEGGQVKLWEVDWGGTALEPGQRVRGEGTALTRRYGDWTRVSPLGPVVDNDGIHAVRAKSGATYLERGRHAFRLEWFNATGEAVLEVQWRGPGVPESRVPPEAYAREEIDGQGRPQWRRGLRYVVYPAAGEQLPTWDDASEPLGSGVCAEPDLAVVAGKERVAVVFTGYLEIPESGVWEFTLRSDDGSRLFVGERPLRWEVLGSGPMPSPQAVWPGQPLEAEGHPFWASVRGRVLTAAGTGRSHILEVGAATGRMRVELVEVPSGLAGDLQGRWVQLTGVCLPCRSAHGPAVAGHMLVQGPRALSVGDEGTSADAAGPAEAEEVLRTAAAVHRLSRPEAARGHRANLEGTVTCVLAEHQAVVIQDHTRGLYVVDRSPRGEGLPRPGDRVWIDGETDPGLFAPMVYAKQVRVLGTGVWPEPVQASWEQLNNGSLDAQWVELRGWVMAVRSNGVSLLLPEGLLEVELRLRDRSEARPDMLEDALVRLRGCLLASWDHQTHQVRAGRIRLYGAEVCVEQPPPEDPFALPLRPAGGLRLFDPAAGMFQRVRILGQLLVRDGSELWLLDGDFGVRAWLRSGDLKLAAGDLVEVVGFPDLSVSGVPVLRQAVVRKVGKKQLPEPQPLLDEDAGRASLDLRRVQVEGLLADQRQTPQGWVLALQQGWRSLTVRWVREDAPPALALGSRIRLTGLMVPGAADALGTVSPTGFELLVGPADEWTVLARPPFWTLERLLIMLGMLVGVLLLATLWITQLHRQVERRKAALEGEIRARQRLEQQQVLEQERARVARDLHDELGSDLTEIAMLLARAQTPQTSPERSREYLGQATAKARQTVTALDEIVWAMNPRHDSVGSLVSYLCLHAERFLSLAGIAWRLEEGQAPPELPLDSSRRHHLFLAFKEALTNVVRHSSASEVRFRLDVMNGELVLTVRDNGRGLPTGTLAPGRDGLGNLRNRCEKLGGRLEVESRPGGGTTLRFCLPLVQGL